MDFGSPIVKEPANTASVSCTDKAGAIKALRLGNRHHHKTGVLLCSEKVHSLGADVLVSRLVADRQSAMAHTAVVTGAHACLDARPW